MDYPTKDTPTVYGAGFTQGELTPVPPALPPERAPTIEELLSHYPPERRRILEAGFDCYD